MTDPLGRVTRTYSDAEGRTTRTVQDFTDGVVTGDSNATTGSTYNAAGTTGVTAYQSGGGGQTTSYDYGVSQTTGSAVDSNDVVTETVYPDPTSGAPSTSQHDTTTYNALGQVLTFTDRNGTTHTYGYDVLGRPVSDAVTTLGSGVDGAVRLIITAYDGQGNPYLVTSYDAVSGGSVVNQVQRVYNGLGQMTAEYQAQSGTVNTSTTPAVQYAYTEMSGGVDNSRLTSITYPDGYVLTDNYSSGLNSTISRLSSLSDSTGTLEAYKFLGEDTVVERDHPQTGVNQTLISPTGATGSAGDQYVGLDAFGRVVDDLWVNTTTSTVTDEFQYAYNAAGDRTSMTNGVNSAFSQTYSYDGLDQLTGYTQGASTSQSYSYNGTGDTTSVTTNGTAQAFTSNAQNEITGVGGATTPTYDANGNMTGDQTGLQYVYDAWNRLVSVKSSGGTTLETFGYDGAGRRVTNTVSGTTTDLFDSAQGQVLEETQGGAATARYVWSPVYVNALVLRDAATTTPGTLSQRVWVQQDANWNVTALTDGSGAVVERYVYSAYGVVTVMDASWTTVSSSAYEWLYGYQGMRLDGITQQNESFSRWYSAALQRWTTPDPTGFGGGDVNEDRFVGNGPINKIDPSGLDEWTWSPKDREMMKRLPSPDKNLDGTPRNPVTYGKFSINMTPYRRTISVGIRGTIEFMPSGVCPECKQIKMIQTVREVYDDNETVVGDSISGTKGALNTPKGNGILPGLRVDVNGAILKKFGKPSLYYQDNVDDPQNKVGTQDFNKGINTPSIIFDNPHSSLSGIRMEFETVAVCVDTGKILGSVRWGFVTLTDKDANLIAEQLPLYDGYASNKPSKSYHNAVDIFNNYFKGK